MASTTQEFWKALLTAIVLGTQFSGEMQQVLVEWMGRWVTEWISWHHDIVLFGRYYVFVNISDEVDQCNWHDMNHLGTVTVISPSPLPPFLLHVTPWHPPSPSARKSGLHCFLTPFTESSEPHSKQKSGERTGTTQSPSQPAPASHCLTLPLSNTIFELFDRWQLSTTSELPLPVSCLSPDWRAMVSIPIRSHGWAPVGKTPTMLLAAHQLSFSCIPA